VHICNIGPTTPHSQIKIDIHKLACTHHNKIKFKNITMREKTNILIQPWAAQSARIELAPQALSPRCSRSARVRWTRHFYADRVVEAAVFDLPKIVVREKGSHHSLHFGAVQAVDARARARSRFSEFLEHLELTDGARLMRVLENSDYIKGL
jgi:hypothetical protein